jgi:hypothetical protein
LNTYAEKIFGRLLAASFGQYCSKCGKNPQLCKNLGTWKLIGSSHRLCKLSINSALASLLAQLPRTKSKQKLERIRRTKKKNQKQKQVARRGVSSSQKQRWIHNVSPSFLTKIVDHNAYRRNRIPEEQLSVKEAASNRSRWRFLKKKSHTRRTIAHRRSGKQSIEIAIPIEEIGYQKNKCRIEESSKQSIKIERERAWSRRLVVLCGWRS